jgi:hypothetical protein
MTLPRLRGSAFRNLHTGPRNVDGRETVVGSHEDRRVGAPSLVLAPDAQDVAHVWRHSTMSGHRAGISDRGGWILQWSGLPAFGPTTSNRYVMHLALAEFIYARLKG